MSSLDAENVRMANIISQGVLFLGIRETVYKCSCMASFEEDELVDIDEVTRCIASIEAELAQVQE